MSAAVSTGADGRLGEVRDGLVTLAAVHKEEGDELRQLPRALADAFFRHDVYRLLLPADLGGAGVEPLEVLQLVEDVARIDGSTGWNLAIGVASAIYLGYLPPELGRDMAAGPICGIAGAYAPSGRGEAVAGGYRVSGRWGWASGIADARWIVFGFKVETSGGGADGTGEARTALAPRECFNVLDTWHVSGMRGTGSSDYEVADLFVPAEMTFRMFAEEPRHPAPVFRLPGAFFSAAIATVGIGIAKGAADGLIRLSQAKQSDSGRVPMPQDSATLYAVGKARALAESSAAYLRQAVGEIWQRIGARDQLGLDARARARRASVHAAESAAKAVDFCSLAAGGSAIRQSEPFERSLRDVRGVIAHAMLQQAAMEDVGRTDFSLPPLLATF